MRFLGARRRYADQNSGRLLAISRFLNHSRYKKHFSRFLNFSVYHYILFNLSVMNKEIILSPMAKLNHHYQKLVRGSIVDPEVSKHIP
jgi:hypothetical protein